MRRTGATRADSSASERRAREQLEGESWCEDCLEIQFEAPDGAGITCANGHGGAPGVGRDEYEARIRKAQFALGPIQDDDLDEGDELSVTVGREVFTPVKFQTFDVGPCTATVKLRKNESVRDAMLRASNVAHSLFRAEYEEKVAGFLVRVREASETARRGR